MEKPIEPGLLYIFRYFTGIAVIYFAILAGYSAFAAHSNSSQQTLSLINLGTNLFLFIYLAIPWLQRKLKRVYLPLALCLYTGLTVFSNIIYIFEPGTDSTTMIINSWELVPILLIPLVLISWQYSFRYVLLFIICTNGTELVIMYMTLKEINYATLPILGLPIIHAFAFGVVGFIIERLMDIQRKQKHRLLMANIQLGQYANTLDHLVTSRERNRLARELHDTLAHTLSGVAVNLEAIKTMIAPEQKEVTVMLDHSLAATRLGLEETRRALQDLRAQPLEDLGYPLAIRNIVQALSDREGISTTITIEPDLPVLPPDVEQSLYRITQEAIENISRHADANHVTLEMKKSGNKIELIISDDGNGFAFKENRMSSHFGLSDMRERAAIIGAKLNIDSHPGKGTTVHLVWEKMNDQDFDL
jgi:signal transduction histidine kinase